MIPKEKLDQLRKWHEHWLSNNPFTSRGQLEDSGTIISLLNEIDRLNNHCKDWECVKEIERLQKN
jgi:hypothetical protein